jgi:hypothetical protein
VGREAWSLLVRRHDNSLEKRKRIETFMKYLQTLSGLLHELDEFLK